MHPDALQLEKLRQQIEDAEYVVGDRMDYISYGKPNAAQKKETDELIVRMRAQSKEARAQLHEVIPKIRTEKPDAFTEWVNYHRRILDRIVAEPVKDANSRTRQHVARGTLGEWDKVLAGEQEYININWNFLKDYKAEVRKLFPQSAAAVVKPEKEKKKPWQFWK